MEKILVNQGDFSHRKTSPVICMIILCFSLEECNMLISSPCEPTAHTRVKRIGRSPVFVHPLSRKWTEDL